MIDPHTLLPADVLRAFASGKLADPFAWRGPHLIDAGWRIATVQPDADQGWILKRNGERIAEMTRVLADGVFVGLLPASASTPDYDFEFVGEGRSWRAADPYAFGPVLGQMDVYLAAEGKHRRIYEVLGARRKVHENADGISFAVWAPNARRVSVVGSFNGWDGRRHPMRLRYGAGIWEIFIPGLEDGELYKFEIVGAHGELLPWKTDPYSLEQETPPASASRVRAFPDAPAHSIPPDRNSSKAPISIYEMHLGSWRRGLDNELLSYGQIADELVSYIRDMGFTHVEFMPVSEHPFAGSWGYQPIGLFAPSRRFGEAHEFGEMVRALQSAGIGVILDWVPAHFPGDDFGLAQFDGTALYEHADPRLGRHRDWDTLIYNFGRREVSNFLASNALFWLKQYGVDALRVDAVASMLYLDYSREPGEWVPNRHGGRENLDAVEFLQTVNELIEQECPGGFSIAEESTAWPLVTRPASEGGLGFRYKWNMGWMHDTLGYMAKEPIHRRWHHNSMTFGIAYAWSENYVLPLSHDEVVYGKGSLLQKMPGDRWQRFANLRAYLAFMWAHPGKKLLFMGGEFAQEREWNHDRSLDWHLLGEEKHAGVQNLVRDLNRCYRQLPALHELDCSPSGFAWIEPDDSAQSVFSFERRDAAGNSCIVVCNFTPVVRHNYSVGVRQSGSWREVMNTDAAAYGGENIGNGGVVHSASVPLHGRNHSIQLTLPPLAVLILEPCNNER